MTKKIRLRLDELEVSTFATEAPVRGVGTVRAHVNTGEATCADTGCGWTAQLTVCYGACGGVSGMTCACATQGCTADPNDFHCHNSQNYCDPTVQVTSCEDMCQPTMGATNCFC